MTNAKEIELDAIAQNGEVQVYCIAEHVEAAGVHSGDATIVYPPQRLYLQTEKRIIEIGKQLAKAFHITGPFNIQFIAKENKVYVIEANLRASRTLPFISKATKVNFVTILVDSLFGKSKKREIDYPNYVAVKVPQFSFSRLEGADPILRVEMSSTGEAAAFGNTVEQAFLKAEISVGAKIPKKGIFVSLGGEANKVRFLESAFRLKEFGLPIFATEKTARFLTLNGIPTKRLHKLHEKKQPNFLTYFQEGKIDLVINIVEPQIKKEMADGYVIRRTTIDHNIQLFTDRSKADLFVKALTEYDVKDLEVKPWNKYI
jgi:carbamoyl-phosphate synthase large subunit